MDVSFTFQCREREILQQLEVKEESALEIRDTYTSLQEEVDMKTKKLHKVWYMSHSKLTSQAHAVWPSCSTNKEAEM